MQYAVEASSGVRWLVRLFVLGLVLLAGASGPGLAPGWAAEAQGPAVAGAPAGAPDLFTGIVPQDNGPATPRESVLLPPGIAQGTVGTLSGAVSVGPSGAAGWATALQVLPGVGGIEPSLGISYGGSGYGSLGLGFSLDSGGMVSRCARTLARDGAPGPILWAQSDQLCLNGARLEAVKGAQGATGTEYRVDNNPNTRVLALGESTSEHSGFVVYTPDGRQTVYGVKPPQQWTLGSMQWAQVDGKRIPFAWHMTLVRDTRTGNEMHYRYAGEAVAGDGLITPEDHRMLSIGYGINPKAGVEEASRQVLFDYARVDDITVLGQQLAPAWVHQGYVAGQSYTRWQMLTRVTMQVREDGDWNDVRQYRLGYEGVPDVDTTPQLSTPDRLRLRALQLCAAGATSQWGCFWPTLFEWSALTEQDGDAVNPMQPMPGFGWDGASFYPLPPASELETTVYRQPSPGMTLVFDPDGDGDDDMLVMPEFVNIDDGIALQKWEYWQTDPEVHGPVQTNVPAWSMTPWTSRAGTVVPKTGSILVSADDAEQGDAPIPRPPDDVLTGYNRDKKAPPGAFVMNYDGTGGADVLLGEPVEELAGAFMDSPPGLGSKTAISRGTNCNSTPSYSKLLGCVEDLERSRADYTGHPGFMKGFKVLRLQRPATGGSPDSGAGGTDPGATAQFEQISLNYHDGRPAFWAVVMEMNGDGLTDLMFCKADADYAAVAGQPMPMFYPSGSDEFEPRNWVSGTMHYQLNVPGAGIDLSNGGTQVITPDGNDVPCHAKDTYLVLDLDGDGTQSLLHHVHGHVRQMQISGITPSVPDGVMEDPYPVDLEKADLEYFWPKLLKGVWAQKGGQTYYNALTYRADQGGVEEKPTNLPVEQFMLWQQQPGNTPQRYSTHQSVKVEIGKWPEDVDGEELGPDQWWGRITDWADPDSVMAGFGQSPVRVGDVNGDDLFDVLMVDQSNCKVMQKTSPGEKPKALSEACSFRSIFEWGQDLYEQTFEKVAVYTYLNRGDGSFELSPDGSLELWKTDFDDVEDAPAEMLDAVMLAMHWNVELDPDLNLDGQQIDHLYRTAWTQATAATRGWRMEFGSSLMGDPNGDGLADLGYIKTTFDANGGWLGDSLSGTYTLEPAWHLARHGAGLSDVATPMGLDIETLVPDSETNGWPGWQEDLSNKPTEWKDAGDSAATVGPYEQQAYGLAARLMQLDVNKDGRPELAFYDHVRGQYKLATPAPMSEPQPHLLTAVTDGLGARTELDYAPQWTLTTPSTPWTQDDIHLPYPLYRRPSVAPAVAVLRTDSGQDAGDAPVYLGTRYRYGKTTMDVRRGISLGIERSYSKQSVATPSGTVEQVRLARYDVEPDYDDSFQAYPLAGSLRSETIMAWGSADAAVEISHTGQRHSAHAGKVGATWYRRMDASTASTFEVGEDVPASAAGTLFECLVAAYDGAQECTLGPQASYQPLAASTTSIGYYEDGYGLMKNQIVDAAGTSTVTERTYLHKDPASVLDGPYLLGLPELEWVAHEPAPGAGYTLRTVQHAYDDAGQLATTTIEPDQPKYRVSTSLTYDAFGNVASRTLSADGHPDNVTTYEYSASGIYPTKVTNALGHSTTTQWNEGCALPERVTNALGHTQVNTLDPFCRERGGQLFFGDVPLTRKTTIDYEEWEPDANEGYPDREVLVTTAVEGGAKGYALSNRVGQTFVQQGPGFGFEVYTRTRYDVLGRVTEISMPTQVGEQPLGWTKTTYDGQGRVVEVAKPDDTVQSTHYDRYVTTVTNELGDSSSSETNALGQVVKVTPPEDPDLPDVDLSMRYTYGAFGTLVEAAPYTATSAKGPTTLTYDDYGRLTKSEDAQAGVRITRYDAFGRIDESEDALGQVTKIKYDVVGRMIERIQAWGTPEAKSATWSYDKIAPGILTEAVNADGTVIEAPLLDDYFRPTGSVTTIHGRSYTQQLSYDAWGRVASQSYPSHSVLAPVQTWNQYNDLDQLVGLSFQNQTAWRPVTADVWGHLTEQRYGADTVIATASYAPLTGRLEESKVTQRTWHNADLYNDTLIEHYTYDWYDHGLIRTRAQPSLAGNGQEQLDRFVYTPRGELKRWSTIGANQLVKHNDMAYDGFGNVKLSPNGEYTYFDEKLLQIKGPSGWITYTYTGNGQVRTRTHAGGETALTYDPLNRVSQIDAPGSSQIITYTADGTKARVLGSDGRETIYVGAYQEERGGALGKTIVGRYALGPLHLTRTWQQDLTYTDQRTYTPPADHLGSTTLVTSELGAVLDRRAYDTWGNEREPTDWNAFKAAPKDDTQTPATGYTGHHERKQFGATAAGISGLIDMHTRYYDPTAMRFLQPDSIVPEVFQSLSWNRFTYVDNSPVMFSDPTGMARQLMEPGEEAAARFEQDLNEDTDTATTTGQPFGATAGAGTVAGALLSNLRKVSKVIQLAHDAQMYELEQQAARTPNEDCMACTKVKGPGHTASELNALYEIYKKRHGEGHGLAALGTDRSFGFVSFADFAMWYEYGGGKETIERAEQPPVGGVGAVRKAGPATAAVATGNRARAIQLAARARATRAAVAARHASTATAVRTGVTPGAEGAARLASTSDVRFITSGAESVRVGGVTRYTTTSSVLVNNGSQRVGVITEYNVASGFGPMFNRIGVGLYGGQGSIENVRFFLERMQAGNLGQRGRLIEMGTISVWTNNSAQRNALAQGMHNMTQGVPGVRIFNNQNGVRMEILSPRSGVSLDTQ